MPTDQKKITPKQRVLSQPGVSEAFKALRDQQATYLEYRETFKRQLDPERTVRQLKMDLAIAMEPESIAKATTEIAKFEGNAGKQAFHQAMACCKNIFRNVITYASLAADEALAAVSAIEIEAKAEETAFLLQYGLPWSPTPVTARLRSMRQQIETFNGMISYTEGQMAGTYVPGRSALGALVDWAGNTDEEGRKAVLGVPTSEDVAGSQSETDRATAANVALRENVRTGAHWLPTDDATDSADNA